MTFTNLEQIKKSRYLPGPEVINIYKIFGTITTRTPLHLGSGESGKAFGRKSKENEAEENCSLIFKDYRGIPCIPGSSLKGVIRTWLETHLMPFNFNQTYDVAMFAVDEIDNDKNAFSEHVEKKKVEFKNKANINSLLADFYSTNLDIISGIFGFQRYMGKLEIENSYIKNPETWNEINIFTMPGVAIDYITGTAKEHSLFTYELVAPKVNFGLELTLKNVRLWELGMVFSVLDSFNNEYFPLKLGGLNGIGYGQINLNIESICQLGDDDIKKAGGKILNDFNSLNSNTNGLQNWKSLSIADHNKFRLDCISEFVQTINLLNGDSQ
ncbi:MAG: hypothetical protein HY934_00250 [Candidatus Firestonebacteria bacterium]|nr:hypothetical protein [Candidatus Firestonebacteria bacterium]